MGNVATKSIMTNRFTIGFRIRSKSHDGAVRSSCVSNFNWRSCRRVMYGDRIKADPIRHRLYTRVVPLVVPVDFTLVALVDSLVDFYQLIS